MAKFKMTIEAVWENDGYFEEYVPLVKSEHEVHGRTTKRRSGKKNKNKFVKRDEMSEEEDSNDNTNDEMSEDEADE